MNVSGNEIEGLDSAEIAMVGGGHRVTRCVVIIHEDGREEVTCEEVRHDHPHKKPSSL